MEALVRLAWLSLAALHVMPALALFAPVLTDRLYGVAPDGDVGILIVHRGALFLAMIVAALFAMVDPSVRRAMSVVLSISVVGFLLVYLRAGAPEGPLRLIAIADAAALLPLAVVAWTSWRAAEGAG